MALIRITTAARRYTLNIESVRRLKREEKLSGKHGWIEEQDIIEHLRHHNHASMRKRLQTPATMRTLLLLALLLPLACAAQPGWEQYRALRIDEVDPYEQYIFQRTVGNGKLPDGRDACVGLFIIRDPDTGNEEWVRIATSMELCNGNFPTGTQMNFTPKVICNDSIQ